MAVGIAGVSGAGLTYRPTAMGTSRTLFVCVYVAVFAAGGLRYAAFTEPFGTDVSFLPEGAKVRLVGRPTASASTQSGIRFVLDVDSAFAAHRTLPFSGRVQVYLRGSKIDAASPCRRLSVEGRLANLPEVRNPGGFDYAGYLRGHRIFTRMFADGYAAPSASGASRDRGEQGGAACVAHRLKKTIESYFQRSIRDDAARSIILALVVGDRAAIDGETQERFRRTGLLHLLAVSGLHVLIVGMILYQLLRPILLRMRLSWLAAEYVRTAVTSIVLLLYALVTGLPASVVRAVVMAILFMIGTTFQRSSHSLNTLGAAVFILLTFRPPHLFEPGFQLSVGAVAAIITLQPRFSSMLEMPGDGVRLGSFLRSSLAVSLAAAAGTLPVLLVHFGSVSFAGLFLNTVAVPLTSVTLASSVTTAVAASFSDILGVTFGHASQFFARFLLYLVEHGEPYFEWAYVEAQVDDAPVIGALVVGIFMLAQWPRPRIRWRLCAAALSLLAIDLVWDALEGEWRASLEVVFLDVGQGDAALITFPNGRALLVDAGPRTVFIDAGRYVVLPHLQRRRIRKLDGILITHPDSDHLGGLPTLLRNVAVNRVLHSGRTHSTTLYGEVAHLVDSLKIHYQTLRAGDTLSIDASVRIHVLHPDHPRNDADPNASSIVLHVRYGRTAMLLMGDAERDAEHDIIRRYGELATADVVKVGHHGSETSSTRMFLSRVVRPNTIAVVSAGVRNRFRHPDSVVVRRLRSLDVDIKRTDLLGAVRIRSDGRHATVEPWR